MSESRPALNVEELVGNRKISFKFGLVMMDIELEMQKES
jgi:hypothetical protein